MHLISLVQLRNQYCLFLYYSWLLSATSYLHIYPTVWCGMVCIFGIMINQAIIKSFLRYFNISQCIRLTMPQGFNVNKEWSSIPIEGYRYMVAALADTAIMLKQKNMSTSRNHTNSKSENMVLPTRCDGQGISWQCREEIWQHWTLTLPFPFSPKPPPPHRRAVGLLLSLSLSLSLSIFICSSSPTLAGYFQLYSLHQPPISCVSKWLSSPLFSAFPVL